MNKLLILLTTFISFQVYANTLPNPSGTLVQADQKKCNGEVTNAVLDNYRDAIMKVPGVIGVGRSVLLESENPFKIRCSSVSVFILTGSDTQRIKATIGQTLEGLIVEYTETSQGSIQ